MSLSFAHERMIRAKAEELAIQHGLLAHRAFLIMEIVDLVHAAVTKGRDDQRKIDETTPNSCLYVNCKIVGTHHHTIEGPADAKS